MRTRSRFSWFVPVSGALAVAFALAVAEAQTTPASTGTAQTASAPSLPAPSGVRVWQDTLTLPTYEEGPPDPNPPFDLFTTTRFNYPYTLRMNTTGRSAPRAWRALNLENAYLKCVVLPDLGGHLYSCRDKINNAEMFYANPSIKFAQIAYRGAWTALGVEFNFPVSHNWMTASPVDFATTANPDGSASVWIGNIDRPYGMAWRVELRLRPGEAALQQHTTLYNRSDARHRFYWWTNAGVEVSEDSRIIYPMDFTASHGFADIDTWPVDSRGTDNSIVGNHKFGPVSRFSHGSREPYMAVYHPKTKAGVVHYASPVDLPSKKIWSWSSNPDGLDWRRALSDNNSAYVEIQAGIFRNQETYGFLEPQDNIRFTEYWLPIRGLGGVSRANPNAVVHLSRDVGPGEASALTVSVNVTRDRPRASLTISDGPRIVATLPVSLTPATTFSKSFPGLKREASYTVTLKDASGAVLLQHTEGRYDVAPAKEMVTGKQPTDRPPAPDQRTDGDWLTVGTRQELDGERLIAFATYQDGRRRFPKSLPLAKAAGRLAVDLKQFDAAAPLLEEALARDNSDLETWYYMGLARAARGDARGARLAWEQSQSYGAFRSASLLQLAALEARSGNRDTAAAILSQRAADPTGSPRAGGIQVALWRALGRTDRAKSLLASLQREDPTNNLLRVEATKLGHVDPALWPHLAADPERIIEVAVDYLRAGLHADAIGVLSRDYPSGPGVVSEVGMPRPETYPLIAYYRGYAKQALGQNGRADFDAASGMPLNYVFPHRPDTLAVLRAAIEANADDASAHFLLGSLYLSGGMTDAAMREWETTRRLNPRIPTLHRNMGYTVLATDGDADKAIALFREGTQMDAANVGLYYGLNTAMTKAHRPAGDRADALANFPDQRTAPATLIYKLAIALAEAGRFDEADALFPGRFFPRNEGGINVRQIYLEVKVRRAVALAAKGDCAKALGIVDHLNDAVPGLAFTEDGLEPFIASAKFEEMIGEVRRPCGVAGSDGAQARYGVGTWIPDALGNHRAIVKVSAAADAVRVHLPWRRRDRNPDLKSLVVVDAKTDVTVANVARLSITRESGDVAFQPATAPGDYYVYYLPIAGNVKTSYPKVTYPPPAETAHADWRRRNQLTPDALPAKTWPSLPTAEFVEFQAVDELNSFFPMEVIATSAETEALIAGQAGANYLLFPEDRAYSIRMTDDLPQRWILKGAAQPFTGAAARGEFYAFQIGVFAARKPIEDVAVSFSGLFSAARTLLVPPTGLKSFNQGGIDSTGRPFTRPLSVAQGKVQAMWFGVQVPEGAAPGTYAGTVTITPRGERPTSVSVAIEVSPTVIRASGDDNPASMSRLRWLDSTLAEDDDIVKPYTAMTVQGDAIGVLGRRVTLGRNGLPASIRSHFAIEMTGLSDTPREILSGPVAIVAEGGDKALARWKNGVTTFTKRAPGAVAWKTTSTGGPLTMATQAQMEFDGNIEFAVNLTATATVDLDDLRLEIPIAKDVAKYMLGFGRKGGLRPAVLEWKWDVKNNQDGAWLGDVNAGLQFSLKDEKYVRPLNTNFYTLKPLVMPASWSNGGLGGCRLSERGAAFLVTCYSGARTIKPGDPPLRFDFRLLITPFKPIDPKAQFSTRYFHAYEPVEKVIASGANTVNIHHANEINPFINYPFLRPEAMKAYVDEAHAKGLKVKIYYTVRELTNHAPELFALLSLGHEVLSPGPGGGYSWLQEHAGSDYIAGWFVPPLRDAALINSGVSRWHNFYVEGLNWLVKNVAIDGLYIDDVAFDRFTMKRVRKVLDRGRPGALIDLHSANQFNVRDGFANSANLYLEHFPFLDRLWFGEYFDYASAPDFWMTEVSGLPFGLMSEMLQDGGNPWRGMVFGMTARMPRVEMRPLWKAWDDFGIADSRMIGYWVPTVPVKTNNPDVLATVYAREGKAMIALASWAKEPVKVRLAIDWAAVGLDPANTSLVAPAVADFQPAITMAPGDEIEIAPGRGFLLVLSPALQRGRAPQQ